MAPLVLLKKDIPLDKTKRELTIHGPPEFPIAIYDNYPSNYGLGFINWHWHNEVQFCLITSGKVSFSVGGMVNILIPSPLMLSTP